MTGPGEVGGNVVIKLVSRFNPKQVALAFVVVTAVLTSAVFYWESHYTAVPSQGEIAVFMEANDSKDENGFNVRNNSSKGEFTWQIDNLDLDLGGIYGRPITDSNPCDVSMTLKSMETWRDLDKYSTCRQVFYNRVPKCGSRTVTSTFKELSRKRGYTVHGWDKINDRSNYVADRAELLAFLQNYSRLAEPFLLSQHLFFLNFTSVGLQPPMYINVIRNPVERLVSHYYYNLYGSGNIPVVNRRANYNQSLDECVRKRENACLGIKQYLPYFCGQGRRCRNRSPEAVAVAKTTLRTSFLTVGVTEDLPAFMQVLEILAPQFFEGAQKAYATIQKALIARSKTVYKPRVKPETIAFLKDHLRLEYDFYSFVRQRFYKLQGKLTALLRQRDLDLGNRDDIKDISEDDEDEYEEEEDTEDDDDDEQEEHEAEEDNEFEPWVQPV